MAYDTATHMALGFAQRVANAGARKVIPPPNWRLLFVRASGPVPIELTRSFGLPISASWFQLAEALAVNLPGQTPIQL